MQLLLAVDEGGDPLWDLLPLGIRSRDRENVPHDLIRSRRVRFAAEITGGCGFLVFVDQPFPANIK